MEQLFDFIKSGTLDIVGSVVIGTVISVLYIITYPLYAYGLYKIAKSRNLEYPWIAFIPKFNNYILGTLIGEIKILGKTFKNIGTILLILAIVSMIPIPFIGTMASIVFSLFYWISIHRIYKIYVPERADLYLILGIVSGCLTPFLIFSVSDFNEKHSKLVIDDDADGNYDREIYTLESGEVIENNINTNAIKCKCGQIWKTNENFCIKCGMSYEDFINRYRCSCGHVMDYNDKFCPKCGKGVYI